MFCNVSIGKMKKICRDGGEIKNSPFDPQKQRGLHTAFAE
jgi:hypothetical protein